MAQNRTRVTLALVALLACLLVAGVQAAQQPAAAPAGSSPAAPEIGTFHNPTDWLEMGADLRFREHYGYNWTALNSDKEDSKGNDDHKFHFERYRARWWTTSKLDEDTTINTRFTWEFRTWEYPASKAQDTDFDEIIMDNLNLKMKNFLGSPTTAIIGRQDLFLGQGWLVADGTPLDGSRTFYYDAARFTVDLAEKTKLDLIYIRNMPNSDWFLKPINDRHKYVTQEQEQGAIVYLTDKSTPTQLEGYFMYKNNNPVEPTSHKAFAWPQAVINLYSKKAEIFTFGGAASAPINDNWDYRVEGAFQCGTSASPNSAITANDETESLRAFGAKGDLQYSFKDELNNRLHVVYEYLSGDDPGSNKVESFNPLWGQWPQWSELYQPYVTQLEENLVSNLHRVAFGHKFKPCTEWEILTDYHLLWAEENTFEGNSKFSNDDLFRGQLLTCWARYNFTKQLKGNLVFEYMLPGHYYGPNNRDHALYFHWTVEYTF
jgi:hypothetical protein